MEHISPLKARIAMLAKTNDPRFKGLPFFATLAMRLEPVSKPAEWFPGGIGTVATDGKHFFYNPVFWDGLTLEQQMFCWAHEVMHAACGHLFRRGNREPMKWNIAGDLCINPILKAAGLDAPAHALFKVGSVTGENDFAENVYERLPDQQQGGKCSCAWVGPSQHGDGDSDGKQKGDGDQDGDGCAGDEALETQAEDWKSAAIQAAAVAQQAGKLPGGLKQFVSSLLPKINWKQRLRRWLGQRNKVEYSFLPPSRRWLHAGLYLPALGGDKLQLAFIVDTSGSMYAPDVLGQALAEIRAIKQVSRVSLRVIDADTKVHQERFFDVNDRLPVTAEFGFKGGGGTNIQSAFDWLQKNHPDVDGILCFTDGYTSPCPITSKLACPTIWLMTTDAKCANFGERVEVKPC